MNHGRRATFWIIASFVLLAICVGAVFLRSISGPSFVGTWSGGSYPAPGTPYPNTLEIRPDGTYVYLGATGRWHQESGRLVLESMYQGHDASLQIERETGLLQDGFVDGLSFKRVGTRR